MNKLILSGDIAWYDISAYYVRKELDMMSGDVEIQINSGGGSFFEGVEIFNILREYASTKGQITTVNTSLCASAASHIFCAGDIRKAYKNSTIMIHKSWSLAMGDANAMTKEAQILTGIDQVQVSTYTDLTGLSEDEQKTLLDDETWYIGENALLESGLVTDIIGDDREPKTDQKTSYELAVSRLQAKGEYNIDMDKVTSALKSCGVECKVATMPTAQSNKIANQTQGETMEFNEDNFKALLANRTTLSTRLETVSLDLETANADLAKRDAEIKTLTEGRETDVKTAVDTAQESFVAQTETRIKEAYAQGAQKSDTVISMINAESDEKASEILLNAEPSEPSPKGEKLAQVDPWAKIINKRKKG